MVAKKEHLIEYCFQAIIFVRFFLNAGLLLCISSHSVCYHLNFLKGFQSLVHLHDNLIAFKDESHLLKDGIAQRTKAATEVAVSCFVC